MWLEKAKMAGFANVKVLSRTPMGEDRLPLYPVYQDGSLDTLFDLVGPSRRWNVVQSATIQCYKARRAQE